jgi:hypothetical protein
MFTILRKSSRNPMLSQSNSKKILLDDEEDDEELDSEIEETTD